MRTTIMYQSFGMILDISAVFHGTLHDPDTWIRDGFIIGQLRLLHFAISGIN
ncbi:MAG: hypothetical protein PVG41_01720 [Desulfobacteraceae bacterium]|jgi:hypothetical protein